MTVHPKQGSLDLTQGNVAKMILTFAIPIFADRKSVV